MCLLPLADAIAAVAATAMCLLLFCMWGRAGFIWNFASGNARLFSEQIVEGLIGAAACYHFSEHCSNYLFYETLFARIYESNCCSGCIWLFEYRPSLRTYTCWFYGLISIIISQTTIFSPRNFFLKHILNLP